MSEITLDLDNDGHKDRAALVRNDANSSVELTIYFGNGGETPAVSGRPRILKGTVVTDTVVEIKEGHRGGLTIRYGCGGCSNDSDTELRLFYRSGRVFVGGYSVDWDTRAGSGRCDVDLMKGEGFVTHGPESNGVRIKVRSRPVILSSWSGDMISKRCL